MPSSGPGVQGQLQFPQPKPQFRLAHPQPSLELTSEKKGILGMHKALQELRFGKQEETHRGQEPEKEPVNSYRRSLRTAAKCGRSRLISTVT